MVCSIDLVIKVFFCMFPEYGEVFLLALEKFYALFFKYFLILNFSVTGPLRPALWHCWSFALSENLVCV